jgi:hypothetical protein
MSRGPEKPGESDPPELTEKGEEQSKIGGKIFERVAEAQ